MQFSSICNTGCLNIKPDIALSTIPKTVATAPAYTVDVRAIVRLTIVIEIQPVSMHNVNMKNEFIPNISVGSDAITANMNAESSVDIYADLEFISVRHTIGTIRAGTKNSDTLLDAQYNKTEITMHMIAIAICLVLSINSLAARSSTV